MAGDLVFADEVGDMREEIEFLDLRRTLQAEMEKLKPRYKQVVEGLFFHQEMRKDIATKLGVSAPRVSEIERSAIRRLRELIRPRFLAQFELEQEAKERQERIAASEERERLEKQKTAAATISYDTWAASELSKVSEHQRRSWDWLYENVPAIATRLNAMGYERPSA